MQSHLLAFDDSPEGELMRRYYLAKGREFNRLLSTYFKVQREADAAVDGEWDPETVGPELESRLQAALGPEIPAEAVTPTIQPLDSDLQAAARPEIPAEAATATMQPLDPPLESNRAIESGDETNPIPATDRGDETNPIPAEVRAQDVGEPELIQHVMAAAPRQAPFKSVAPTTVVSSGEPEPASAS